MHATRLYCKCLSRQWCQSSHEYALIEAYVDNLYPFFVIWCGLRVVLQKIGIGLACLLTYVVMLRTAERRSVHSPVPKFGEMGRTTQRNASDRLAS